MRILNFNVSGQTMEKDQYCDFSGLVPGSKGYLQAEFYFDQDWAEYSKVAVFEKIREKTYIPIIGNKCEIPEEILTWKKFYVHVVGQKGDIRIKTNKVEVMQDGEYIG